MLELLIHELAQAQQNSTNVVVHRIDLFSGEAQQRSRSDPRSLDRSVPD